MGNWKKWYWQKEDLQEIDFSEIDTVIIDYEKMRVELRVGNKLIKGKKAYKSNIDKIANYFVNKIQRIKNEFRYTD